MSASGTKTRFRVTLSLGLIGFALLSLAQVVNYYREPWLGVQPGYAPHNFAFNLAFYIPSILVSTAFALSAMFFYLQSLIRLKRRSEIPRGLERLTILPTLPVLAFDLLLVVFLVRVVS